MSFLTDKNHGILPFCQLLPNQELLDPDIWEFIVKYNLDDRVMNRLIETLNNPKRKGKSKDTLQVGSRSVFGIWAVIS